MSIDEKRTYLKKYRVQQSKINRMQEMLVECPEKTETYLMAIKGARDIRDKIEQEIEAVDGSLLSEILFQKYICCKSVEQISLDMNYSKRQIERLHLKALDNLKIS